ncbi:MAG: hypothetical protein ACXVE8_20155, partial [Solirubrobacteraceae bacterium]
RDAFSAGWGGAAAVTFVQCLAPADVLRCRARARAQDPGRISDAGTEVVERERDRFEPIDEAPARAHLAVRTDRDVEAVLADVLALLDLRLADGAKGG